MCCGHATWLFHVRLRLFEFVLTREDMHQREMGPVLLLGHFKRGRDPERHFEVVDRLRRLTLGFVYGSEGAVSCADLTLLALLREESDRAQCDALGDVGLIIVKPATKRG
jgi:hypothetical protein